MGFEPTTLRDLVGCSNHWATGDSMVSKGQIMVPHSKYNRDERERTCKGKKVRSNKNNFTD